jgi:hypothetical protein
MKEHSSQEGDHEMRDVRESKDALAVVPPHNRPFCCPKNLQALLRR